MATRTVTVYTCDRCDTEYAPPPLPDPGSKEGAPIALTVAPVHRSNVSGKEAVGQSSRTDLCTACADGLAAYLASGETLTLNLEHVGDVGWAMLAAQNAVAEHRIRR